MHLNRAIHAVDHQVQIPVLIEVAQRHAEGQALLAETPLGRLGLKGAITPITKGQVGRAPLGIQFHPALSLFWGEGAAWVLHPVLGVLIHQVIFKAIGNQQVFVAVEVDIQEDGAPTPITGREAGTEGCLDIAPSGSSEEEHVPIKLGPTCQAFPSNRIRRSLTQLAQAPLVAGGQEIHYQNVVMAIAVHIRHIDAHGVEARVSQCLGRGCAEMTTPIIEPKPIWRGEIVGDVKVRGSVPIEVAEDHRQPPVPSHGLRLALVIEEHTRLGLHRRETSVTVVAVERIGLGQFDHFAVWHYFETISKTGIGGGYAVDLADHPPSSLLAHGEARRGVDHVHHINVMDTVEVEVSITIHVGQSHRGAGGVAIQAAVAFLSPATVAVIEEESRPGGDAVDQQV